MATRADVIVVGAGPSGAIAALVLARAGVRVRVFDRARFPRDKPCGGGVTVRCAAMLPFSLDPVVEDVVTAARLTMGDGREITRTTKAPLTFMTQRRRLDAFLVEQAQAAGVEFRDGQTVTGAARRADGTYTITVGGETHTSRVVIGADGANGVVGNRLGYDAIPDGAVALEGNIRFPNGVPARFRGAVALHFGDMPGGYGWVFPKGDHANFGVGGWEAEGPRLRDHLRRLCEAHGASFDDLEELRGYRLPLREPGSTLARGRALLAGDAAGLIDPVSGDGMFEGFLSSQYASEAVLDLLEGRAASLDPYGPRLAKRLATHLWASWGVKVALDRYPRATFGVASTNIVWGAVERLVRGEVADVGGIKGLARPPLKAIALLARAAGDPGRAYKHV